MEQIPQQAPRQLSETEVNILDITKGLDNVEELNPSDVTPHEDTTEGLMEELHTMEQDRATHEEILDAINKHKTANEGAEPLNASEFGKAS